MDRGSIEAPSSTSKSSLPQGRCLPWALHQPQGVAPPAEGAAKKWLALTRTSSSMTLSTYCKNGHFQGIRAGEQF